MEKKATVAYLSSQSFMSFCQAKIIAFHRKHPLLNNNTVLLKVIIGDETFPLSKHLLRPYWKDQTSDNQKRIFNYRLCRARRTAENAFGILCQTFGVELELLIIACCCLNNLLRKVTCVGTASEQEPDTTLPTENMTPLNKTGGNATLQAIRTRELLL